MKELSLRELINMSITQIINARVGIVLQDLVGKCFPKTPTRDSEVSFSHSWPALSDHFLLFSWSEALNPDFIFLHCYVIQFKIKGEIHTGG